MDIITICNNALGEIAGAFITDLSERSVEAENCARLYPAVLAEALEWDDDGFWFATKRVDLAVVTNDRASEWLFAYAVPDGMAQPIGIVAPGEALTSYPVNGPFPFPLSNGFPRIPYALADGKIYTNQEAASFEYTVNTISPSVMSATFRRAVELELATRLAMPLKKDSKTQAEKARMAFTAKQLAIAENRDRQPRRIQRVSEREYARAGIGLESLV